MKNATKKKLLSCLIMLSLTTCFFVVASVKAQVQPVNWTRLSSVSGELPVPPLNQGQSGLKVMDCDQNGQNDYLITLWNGPESVVWFRHLGDSFEKYVIDTDPLQLSHGERFKDIDNDGDIDLILGDASLGNNMYWWENPYPDFDPSIPWTRRMVRNTGGNFYHDNIWGDFDGDGADEFISWNQYGLQLLLFEIPLDPKNSGSWPVTQIFSWTGSTNKYRGADAIDINLDGKIDFVGGGGWFEHTGGSNFTYHLIDDAMGYSQIKAGQLIQGGRPEVVCILELNSGPLNMYEWNGTQWVKHTLLANVPRSHTLQLGDVNSDGKLDIMTGEMGQWGPVYEPPDNPNAKISVLYGDGTGDFIQQVVFEGQGDLEGQLADIDNDGDLDIVAKPFRHNIPRVDIWLNQGFAATVDVPDIIGIPQVDAEAAILAADLTIGTLNTAYSDTLPAGHVMSQVPFAGFPALMGSQVDLVISLGTGTYQHNFEEYAVGEDPEDWFDTGANNSLLEDATLFKVFDLGGDQAFGTTSTALNIHSHYIGPDIDPLSGYEFTGRMMKTDSDGGIGVTFFSQYPFADVYYRLRQLGNNSFHIAPHGTSISGDIETEVFPSANEWYRFRIQIEDTGSQTEVRARVWIDSQNEPVYWQVEAFDDNPTRLISGAIGVWGYHEGSKYWDNLLVGPLVTIQTMVDVPDVVGSSQADAHLDIIAAGLTLGAVTTDYSDTVPAGYVISQSPLAGTSVPADSPVNLFVSLGPFFVDVPDVVGSSQADAHLEIIAAGLTLGSVTTDSSDIIPAGDVISQAPLPGTSVPAGSPVALVISLGAGVYEEDFEGYTQGDDPDNWYDTGAQNSLLEVPSLFNVFNLDGENVFSTTSTLCNIHSHYTGAGSASLSDYLYTGRMMMTASDSGIGVSFYSHYGDADIYYRLRRYGSGGTFHIAPHGTQISGGTIDTGILPLPNQWYWFKIQVEDTGTHTEIRAKVWAEGLSEPVDWQVDCYDSSIGRLTAGTIGIWSCYSGSKFWDNFAVQLLSPPPTDLETICNDFIDNDNDDDIDCLDTDCDGLTCNDTDACMVDATCTGLACVGTLMDCSDTNICTNDSCVAGSCLHHCNATDSDDPCCTDPACTDDPVCTALETICNDFADNDEDGDIDCLDFDCDGLACNDTDACTTGDICTGLTCVGTDLTCDDDNTCTEDICLSGLCLYLCNVTDSSDPCCTDLKCIGDPVCGNSRVPGELVLYTFTDDGDGIVNDVSGNGTPLNLTITDDTSVSWIPGGGLSINSPTIIGSASSATKVISACQATNEITIEAWIAPANIIQDGPARIVTLSGGSATRNFTLGEGLWGSAPSDRIDVRLRTTTTSNNGQPSLTSPPGSLTIALTHVVYTRTSSGESTIYIDGIAEVTEMIPGDFSNWDNYVLAVGNELTENRPWVGEFYLLAIYDKSLTQEEVDQNYYAGISLTEINCTDRIDNDGDGDTDCLDLDCDGFVCDDSDACTTGDICTELTCMATAMDCNDANSCTDDSCAAGVCLNLCNASDADDPCCTDLTCIGDPVCGNSRVPGELVLYTFTDDGDSIVNDVSGTSPPLNLTIADDTAVSWIPGGGLSINSPTIIGSASTATKVITGCQASNEITIDAWIAPANINQDGPARIVTLSGGASARNFTLGEGLWGTAPSDLIDMRLRTTTTNSNGQPSLTSPPGSLTSGLTHVVYTRTSSGQATIYIDGVAEATATVPGDFSNWGNYILALGNELTEDRSWLGEIYLVALYDKALTSEEVVQNYLSGPTPYP